MSKKVLSCVIALVVASATVAQAPSAQAQQGRMSIGFVDIERLLREAKAAKSIRAQIHNLSKSLSEEATRARDKLGKDKQDLDAKRAILSPERYEQAHRELAQRLRGEQQALEARRVALDRGVKASMAKLQRVFGDIAKEIAKERSIAVLFRRASAILVPSALDITPDVLVRLDKRLPSVAVTIPPPRDAGGGRRK